MRKTVYNTRAMDISFGFQFPHSHRMATPRALPGLKGGGGIKEERGKEKDREEEEQERRKMGGRKKIEHFEIKATVEFVFRLFFSWFMMYVRII